ncbi:hypothetical protein V5O48_014504 [Marasmius crinis-equi]|uniref:Uncharacterized protein n=1 Tax=Marasmius crinis-equi TaxID=585013 RepID=A0ABR3EXE3_9AGAR
MGSLSKQYFSNRFTNWPKVDATFIQLWWPGIPEQSDASIHLWGGIKNTILLSGNIVSLKPLLTILRCFPLSIALPLGLPHLHKAYTWMNFDDYTIDSFFVSPPGFLRDLFHMQGIPVTSNNCLPPEKEFIHRIVTNNWKLDKHPEHFGEFVQEARRVFEENIPKRTRVNFTLYFHVAEQLWARNRGAELLEIYKNEWIAYSHSGLDTSVSTLDGDERYQLIAGFARSVKTHLDPRKISSVLMTDEGVEFLRYIHEQILEHRLYKTTGYVTISTVILDNILKDWVEAMEVIQQAKGLPDDYFTTFPNPESPSHRDTQDSEVMAGENNGLRIKIITLIRSAMTRRAGDAPGPEP